MTLSIELEGLTSPAHERFHGYVQRFANELAHETARQEEGEREESAREPQVTASHVIRANEVVRKPSASSGPRPRSKFDTMMLIVASLASAAAGVMGGYLKDGSLQASLFTGLAIIAILSTIYTVGRRRD